LRCGELANAEVGYREIFRTALVNKSFYSLFSGLVGLLLIAAYQGEARRGLRQAEDLFTEHQSDLKDLPISGIGYGYMGELAFYLNRLEDAETWLSDALDRFQRAGIQDDGPRFRLVLADVKVSLDKPGEADALLREANSVITSEIGERRRLLLGALHSRVRLKQGRLEEPGLWAEQFVKLINQPYCEALQDNTLAWVWLAQGKALEALHFLESRLERLDRNGIRLYQMENLALQAMALQRLGSQAEALEKVQQALSLAEPAGYERVLVGLGFEMAWLLGRLKTTLNPADRLQPYVGRLLAAFPEKDRAGLAGLDPQVLEKPAAASQEWVEEVSEREIEVLRLMARGLNNTQIAETMVVAESTVKKHINHIFGKLDVSNRTQALIRARERNLL
jgi:LuxR family maltose regulon positive regulatory protein